jgi:hypothetical protein
MIILDENIRADQRIALRAKRVPIHQIGFDVGREGINDEQIIPFLHTLRDATFFSRDEDFGKRHLAHPRYCLILLLVEEDDVAEFVRRILHHPRLDTKAKRMGTVVRVSYAGLSIWQRNEQRAIYLRWS